MNRIQKRRLSKARRRKSIRAFNRSVDRFLKEGAARQAMWDTYLEKATLPSVQPTEKASHSAWHGQARGQDVPATPQRSTKVSRTAIVTTGSCWD